MRANTRTGEDPTKDLLGKQILVTRDSEIAEDVQVKPFKPKSLGSAALPGTSRR